MLTPILFRQRQAMPAAICAVDLSSMRRENRFVKVHATTYFRSKIQRRTLGSPFDMVMGFRISNTSLLYIGIDDDPGGTHFLFRCGFKDIVVSSTTAAEQTFIGDDLKRIGPVDSMPVGIVKDTGAVAAEADLNACFFLFHSVNSLYVFPVGRHIHESQLMYIL